MMLVERDESGIIRGCMEAQIVDSQGKINPNGEYLWIEQVDISKGSSFKSMLNRMVTILDALLPNIKWVYWKRRDKAVTDIHFYSRDRLVFLTKKEQLCGA